MTHTPYGNDLHIYLSLCELMSGKWRYLTTSGRSSPLPSHCPSLCLNQVPALSQLLTIFTTLFICAEYCPRWWWGQEALLKRRSISTKLHDGPFKKTIKFILSPLIISNHSLIKVLRQVIFNHLNGANIGTNCLKLTFRGLTYLTIYFTLLTYLLYLTTYFIYLPNYLLYFNYFLT